MKTKGLFEGAIATCVAVAFFLFGVNIGVAMAQEAPQDQQLAAPSGDMPAIYGASPEDVQAQAETAQAGVVRLNAGLIIDDGGEDEYSLPEMPPIEIEGGESVSEPIEEPLITPPPYIEPDADGDGISDVEGAGIDRLNEELVDEGVMAEEPLVPIEASSEETSQPIEAGLPSEITPVISELPVESTFGGIPDTTGDTAAGSPTEPPTEIPGVDTGTTKEDSQISQPPDPEVEGPEPTSLPDPEEAPDSATAVIDPDPVPPPIIITTYDQETGELIYKYQKRYEGDYIYEERYKYKKDHSESFAPTLVYDIKMLTIETRKRNGDLINVSHYSATIQWQNNNRNSRIPIWTIFDASGWSLDGVTSKMTYTTTYSPVTDEGSVSVSAFQNIKGSICEQTIGLELQGANLINISYEQFTPPKFILYSFNWDLQNNGLPNDKQLSQISQIMNWLQSMAESMLPLFMYN